MVTRIEAEDGVEERERDVPEVLIFIEVTEQAVELRRVVDAAALFLPDKARVDVFHGAAGHGEGVQRWRRLECAHFRDLLDDLPDGVGKWGRVPCSRGGGRSHGGGRGCRRFGGGGRSGGGGGGGSRFGGGCRSGGGGGGHGGRGSGRRRGGHGRRGGRGRRGRGRPVAATGHEGQDQQERRAESCSRTGHGCIHSCPLRQPCARLKAAAHSSSGLGHRPLKAEIRGSNPLCATTLYKIENLRPGAAAAPLGRWHAWWSRPYCSEDI